MNCSAPNMNKRPVWLLLVPTKKRQVPRSTNTLNTSFPDQPPLNGNAFRIASIHDNRQKQIVHNVYLKKDYVIYKDHPARYEHNVVDNKQSKVEPKLESVRNRFSSSQNIDFRLPTSEECTLSLPKNHVVHTHTNFSPHHNYESISYNSTPRRKSLEIKSVWSEMDDVVFLDNNDSLVNSHNLDNFKADDETLLVLNTLSDPLTNMRNKPMANTVPIKGILKSGSHSSHSSMSTDFGSDPEAQTTPSTSSNSQQSLESSSSFGSKPSSKKRVHFEERVITKTILPISAFTYHNGIILEETPEVLTIIDDITTHSNYNNNVENRNIDNFVFSNDTNRNVRSSQNQNFYINNHTNPRTTKNENLDNALPAETYFNKIANFFKREKCESEMPFPNDTCLDETTLPSEYDSFYPPPHFTYESKDSKLTDDNVINCNKPISEWNGFNDGELKTAFPYCPAMSALNIHEDKPDQPNTADHQLEMSVNPRDKSNRSSVSLQRQIDCPRTEFLDGHCLSAEEKTLRILDWLNDLRRPDKSGSNSDNMAASAVLVIPRPSLRRRSFVGD